MATLLFRPTSVYVGDEKFIYNFSQCNCQQKIQNVAPLGIGHGYESIRVQCEDADCFIVYDYTLITNLMH